MASSAGALAGEFAGAERRPGNEADAVLLAIVERRLARAVGEVVAVLHGRDGKDLRRRLDLGDAHFREAGATDHLVRDQRLDRVELLVRRHFRNRCGASCQRSIVSTPSRQRLLCACWMRYSGRPSGIQMFGPGAGEAAFGGDMDRSVGVQRLADQVLGEVGPVGIGRVDEIDAEFGQAPERAQRFGAVLWRSPDSAPDDAHRAEAETVDLERAADAEASGLRSVDHGDSLRRLEPLRASGPRAAWRREWRRHCRPSSVRRSCRDRRAD